MTCGSAVGRGGVGRGFGSLNCSAGSGAMGLLSFAFRFRFAPAFGVLGFDLGLAGESINRSLSSNPSRNGSTLLFLGVTFLCPPVELLLMAFWTCRVFPASTARSCSRNLLFVTTFSLSLLTLSNSAFCFECSSACNWRSVATF